MRKSDIVGEIEEERYRGRERIDVLNNFYLLVENILRYKEVRKNNKDKSCPQGSKSWF